MTTNIAGPRALAAAVRLRRLELGLRQADVGRNGGPSHQTIRSIEHATGSGYRPSSLYGLDRALEWTAGTAQAIWDGTKPPSFASPTPASAPEDVRDEEDRLCRSCNHSAQLGLQLVQLGLQLARLGLAAEKETSR